MWEEPTQSNRDREFMGDGFPVALNQSAPASVSRRIRLNVGTCVQLAEGTSQSETQRRNLFLRPAGEFPQPAGSRKLPGPLTFRVGIKFRESIPDRELRLSRITAPACCHAWHPRGSHRRFVIGRTESMRAHLASPFASTRSNARHNRQYASTPHVPSRSPPSVVLRAVGAD